MRSKCRMATISRSTGSIDSSTASTRSPSSRRATASSGRVRPSVSSMAMKAEGSRPRRHRLILTARITTQSAQMDSKRTGQILCREKSHPDVGAHVVPAELFKSPRRLEIGLLNDVGGVESAAESTVEGACRSSAAVARDTVRAGGREPKDRRRPPTPTGFPLPTSCPHRRAFARPRQVTRDSGGRFRGFLVPNLNPLQIKPHTRNRPDT